MGTTDRIENGPDAVAEPIAIVGMGCRFPGGANTPAAFWDLLTRGVDAIREVPPDRWSLETFYDPDPKSRGKMYSRWGGFLDQIDRFDAQFFKISPREAAFMDPQQRLLLEVCWEAFEDGGQDADRIAGTNVGVFIGISTHDYLDMQAKDGYATDIYTNTGGSLSIAANRLSYCFDLHGPSVAVDTACSSSLVAVHLACQSLRSKECRVAVAGGVNCMLTPEATLGFSRAMMLSPNGRCRTFDAAADGYVRGEGAGVVVLKTLSDALADEDPIYAVIVGSGVNQDGHSQGLTVPSADAQEQLLRAVYSRAHVDPARVLYFEAHGTGTPVGDPLEASAIGAALGRGRTPGNALRVGSVKTNIGHLEAGAGIAGLIKSALAIKHRQIPATLHFEAPNPKIPMVELGLRIQRALETIPDEETATVVGVNSFGFGGTNAHVALDRVPGTARATRRESQPTDPRSPRLVPLSARSPEALQAVARALSGHLSAGASTSLADLCHTLGSRRAHHDYRLAVVTHSLAELGAQLEAFAANEPRAGVASGRRPAGRRPKIAFVFSGMGPQWWAMGRELLAGEPVFRAAVEEVDTLFHAASGWSLVEQLSLDREQSRMDEAEVAQPANFALQIGLVALCRSWSILPHAIVGHSAGEVAAAHAAGILSLEDAVSVIYHRSRLQQRATGKGRMLAAGLPAGQAAALGGGFGGRVSLAAINSPRSVTFTGDQDALEQLATALGDTQVFTRLLDGRVPYHSHHMDPLEHELVASLAGLAPRPATIPFYSVVTGTRADGREVDAAYWWANVRQPVQFAPAVGQILDAGIDAFVELGPHPVMARAIAEIQADRPDSVLPVLATLRRETPERPTMLTTAATLYTLGGDVEWTGINGAGSFVALPSYPWQRERCWSEPEKSSSNRIPGVSHPLLQERLASANPTWQGHLAGYRLAYLQDHVIQDAVVFPGAAYVEAALAASRELTGAEVGVLEEMRFKRALILHDDDQPRLQLAVQAQDHTFAIHSSLKPGQPWTLHATGRIGRDTDKGPVDRSSDLAAVKARCRQRVSGSRSYDALATMGFQYGPTFRGVEEVWLGDHEALGRVVCPDPLTGQGDAGHLLHPALLDACFQIAPFATFLHGTGAGSDEPLLPVEVARFRFSGSAPRTVLWCHVKLTKETRNSVHGDFYIFDESGQLVVEINGFKGQRVPNARSTGGESVASRLHELQWFARTLLAPERPRRADYMPRVPALVARLSSHESLEARAQSQHHGDVEPLIDQLCAAYAWEALQQLGWAPAAGEHVQATALAERLGVVEVQRSFLVRLLEILAEAGALSATGTDWIVADLSRAGQVARLRGALEAEQDAYGPVLSLLDRCGSLLGDVLRGSADSRTVLTSEGAVTEIARLYGESPFRDPHNIRLGRSLDDVVGALPPNRTIRVLEVGGGSGGAAAAILGRLPRHRTEYVFTDVSDQALAQARSRFAEYPFVDYARLDLDADPVAQGFPPHSFDVVVAADVLHFSTDLRQALTNISSLLSSEGLLVALEHTGEWRLFDILYGPLRDWREFPAADPRSSRAWLPEREWMTLLTECGFETPAAVRDRSAGSERAPAILLARAPNIETGDAPPATALPPGDWVVFADRGGVADDLVRAIESRGDVVYRVSPGKAFLERSEHDFEVRPESVDDVTMLVRSLGDVLPTCRGLVHLWSLDLDEPHAGDGALDEAQTLGCGSVMHLIQALDRAEVLAPPRLFLVTRGAQHVGDEIHPTQALQAMLWGLGRVAMNEQPLLRTTLVDLDPDAADAYAGHLLDELYAGDAEQEIAWRGDGRHVVRLVRSGATTAAATGRSRNADDGQMSFQLEAAKPGALESLRLREVTRRAPGPGEVEVHVRFAGINFRDVMKALGMYLEHLGEAFRFGDESSGVIARVGEGVTEFAVGDEVIAMSPGCFGPFLTVPVHAVFRKPASLTFEEASTIPMVFMTVQYALNHVARIKKGERILIHSAAGGVGLAAVQIARLAGAEIFATAGSPEKRALLKSMGIAHVMDSRSLAFADEIVALTEGRGLDIVLNSLAGEFLVKSLALLRPTGRFVELGKVDFFENNKLGLAPFKRGLSFLGVDLGFLLGHEPELCRSVLLEVIQMFEEGRLQPLPVRTFPVSEASTAFRLIVQARHIGKVALDLTEARPAVVRVADRRSLFRGDATYMVTGGLGGFGLATAEWMVDQGARHLALVGRTGASSVEAAAGLERLREAGAEVVVMKADVGRDASVAALIDDIARTMPPLRGVFHAATVFDDGFLLQLDAGRIADVVSPKAAGAWYLHRHTRDRALDFFVLFSSIASVVGSPGQGNYAAANAFLDGLAHHRRALGLPVLTVNWSAISEVGYLARHPELGKALEQQGLGAISPAEAGSMLALLLGSSRHHVAAIKLEADQLDLMRSSEAIARRLSLVVSRSRDDAAGGGSASAKALLVLLAANPPEARPQLIESALRVDLARLLGVRESQIEADQPLAELGIDSLMSVELETAVRAGLGIDLPLGFLVSDNVTLKHLSQRLTTQSQAAIDLIQASKGSGSGPAAAGVPVTATLR